MSENIPNLSELSEIVEDDKSFILRIVQPGFAGLMDGSRAGRGNPAFRGLHTVPFLISNVHAALSWACAIVGVEPVVIALIRPIFQDQLCALLFAGDCRRRSRLRRGSAHRPIMTYSAPFTALQRKAL